MKKARQVPMSHTGSRRARLFAWLLMTFTILEGCDTKNRSQAQPPTSKSENSATGDLDGTGDQNEKLEMGSTLRSTLTPPETIDLKKRRTLMGINPGDHDKFWDKWKLVTVRFRSAPTEQRFVYANDIAWRTLSSGSSHFEDGAMLGKVAFHVGFDPRFPTSYEPAKFSRIQFMKKDSAKYKATNGWGYALYLRDGVDEAKAFGEDDSKACHACHLLAKDHDYVFSNPVFVGTGATSRKGDFMDQFHDAKWSELPPAVTQVIRQYPGILNRDMKRAVLPMFEGTLVESNIAIAKLASNSDRPVLMHSPDGKAFALARKELSAGNKCRESALIWIRQVQPKDGKSNAKDEAAHVMTWRYCDGKMNRL